MDNQIQEAFKNSKTHDWKRAYPRHMTVKIPRKQNKERIQKDAKKKKYWQLTEKEKHQNYIRLLRRNCES
jgi:hypothetical protein